MEFKIQPDSGGKMLWSIYADGSVNVDPEFMRQLGVQRKPTLELDLWDYRQWSKVQAFSQSRVSMASPKPSIISMIQCDVYSGDLANNGARTEVVMFDSMAPAISSRIKEGDETRHDWLWFFPQSFPVSGPWSDWRVVWQAHQTLGDYPGDGQSNGGPPVQFTLHKNKLRLRVQGGIYDSHGLYEQSASTGASGGPAAGVLWETDLPLGRVVPVSLRAKWHRSSGYAWIELDFDGKPAVTKDVVLPYGNMDGPSGSPIEGGAPCNYVKAGLYRKSTITSVDTVFVGAMKAKYYR